MTRHRAQPVRQPPAHKRTRAPDSTSRHDFAGHHRANLAAMYGEKAERSAADKAADDAFCTVVRKMPKTAPGTIRLFDRGDFFAAYGDDARYVARAHFKTESVIKYLGSSPGLASVPLSRAVAQAFLRDALTTKQLRIEIYVSEGSKGSGTRWRLDKTASPGNLGPVEELLFAHSDMLTAPIIMAIKLTVKEGVKTIGAAYADTSQREIGVTEYIDNDLFSNTESLLIQLGVKEVLMPTDDKATDYDSGKIRTIIERCNIVCTDRKRNEFTDRDIQQDLERLLREDSQAKLSAVTDGKTAMSSAAALVAYLGLMADDSNFGSYHLKPHDLSQYLKLDASALKALNLMPDPTGMGGAAKTMSVFGLLNRCRTAQGTRLLAQWLKQPLVNLHEIQNRLELVDCFVQESDLRSTVSDDFLKSMPDFHRISKRLQKGVATLEDVVRVYQALLLLPGLITALENGGSTNEEWAELVKITFRDQLEAHSESVAKYQEMVETTIDLEELDRHQYIIKPTFDEDLQKIKRKVEKVRDGLDETHREVADDLGFSTDNKTLHFEQNHLYGYCFRLTRKEASAIKGKKEYIELGSKQNGVHFTTKRLKTLTHEYKDLNASYEHKQSSLVKEVVGTAATYCTVLELLNTILAHLDVVCSLANAALAAPTQYVKPKMFTKGEGNVRLVDARHPCLEVQEGITFIANDLNLERGVSEMQIVTGPNTGGKSTYIRQMGVIALMAQIGSFVPCTEGELPIFDAILCRVGAGDSQLKGVSTFMAEMLETAVILQTATKDSLVIIDELGRGTSTHDGFGLAWAISEHLATVTRAFVLFATHFHELTALSQQVEHVKNLHVVVHVDDKPDSLTGKEITLLYKVEPGVCDQSFGIHVAEIANFPPEVVKLAKRKADELEDFSDAAAEAATESKVTSEEVARGTVLVDEMLQDWAKRSAAASQGADGEGDATMEEGDADAKVKRELELLQACFADYRQRLEGESWVREVLAKTY